MDILERVEKWAGKKRGARYQLAKELNLEHGTIYRWLPNDNRRRILPNEENLAKLCKLFKITEEQLKSEVKVNINVTGQPLPLAPRLNRTDQQMEAPVVARIGRGGFQFMFDSMTTERLAVAVPVPAGKRFAWAQVIEDLGPNAPKGSYIGVAEVANLDEVQDGQMVIVNIGKEKRIGRLYRKEDKAEIQHPTDSNQSLELPLSGLDVVGVVVGSFIKAF